MRYMDANPVRANLTGSAARWPWSSHRHYAYGEENDLITDAEEYLALGSNRAERQRAYLHLFAQPLVQAVLVKRPELVWVDFIGDDDWQAAQLVAHGLAPPD
jgi:putative transposase